MNEQEHPDPSAQASRPSLDEILLRLRKLLPELGEKHGVKTLGVFGSYVNGEPREDSDLDILVEFREAPTLFGFVRLENELADLLGVKVDLVMKTALKPRIGKRILSDVVSV